MSSLTTCRSCCLLCAVGLCHATLGGALHHHTRSWGARPCHGRDEPTVRLAAGPRDAVGTRLLWAGRARGGGAQECAPCGPAAAGGWERAVRRGGVGDRLSVAVGAAMVGAVWAGHGGALYGAGLVCERLRGAAAGRGGCARRRKGKAFARAGRAWWRRRRCSMSHVETDLCCCARTCRLPRQSVCNLPCFVLFGWHAKYDTCIAKGGLVWQDMR